MSSLHRDRVFELLDELNAMDPLDLDPATCGALAKLRAKVGYVLAARADDAALEQTALPNGTSRSGAQKLARRLLHGRPWRVKVVSSTEGRWTLALKSYTDIGTVVAYASTPEKAVQLVDALDSGLDPVRTRTPWETARAEAPATAGGVR